MKRGILLGALSFGLAATAVSLFIARRDNAELTAQVTRLTRQNADLRYEVKQASQQATDVGQRAVELDSQLGTTKARTTATEAKSVQLTRELTETKTRLTEREQREVALMAELADLRQKAATGSRPDEPVVLPTLMLAASPAPRPAPAVDAGPYRERIAQLEAQLTQLLTRALAEPAAAAEPERAPAPAPVQYQVVRVGAASTFVVVDYGAEQGARPQAIIRLRRGTSELAQVQISDVRPRFSLAQVLPDTLKGQLQTGDIVVFNP